MKNTSRLKKLGIAIGVLGVAAVALYLKGDSTLEIQVTHELEAPPEACWQVLGEEFADVATWSKGFEKSSLNGPLKAGTMRTVELPKDGPLSGTITQEITEFDRAQRTVGYEMRSGMPAFIRGIGNRWVVQQTASGGCKLTGDATFGLAWWIWPATPLLKKRMTSTLQGFAVEMGDTILTRQKGQSVASAQP